MDKTQSIYSRLGGEPVLREFVDNLYDFMDHFVPVERIRKMHPEDLSNARDRLFMFLSGMLGGPPLYVDAFGLPYLRQKQIRFQIGDLERDQWLFCAQVAINQLDIDEQTRLRLMSELTEMIDYLRDEGGALTRHNGWKSDLYVH